MLPVIFCYIVSVNLSLLVLAAVFLLTSLVSFCPLYTLVGLNTYPAKKK
ncbi:MAG: YgaP-like transmembrane domain [Maribacter sp.]